MLLQDGHFALQIFASELQVFGLLQLWLDVINGRVEAQRGVQLLVNGQTRGCFSELRLLQQVLGLSQLVKSLGLLELAILLLHSVHLLIELHLQQVRLFLRCQRFFLVEDDCFFGLAEFVLLGHQRRVCVLQLLNFSFLILHTHGKSCQLLQLLLVDGHFGLGQTSLLLVLAHLLYLLTQLRDLLVFLLLFVAEFLLQVLLLCGHKCQLSLEVRDAVEILGGHRLVVLQTLLHTLHLPLQVFN